MKQLVLLVLLVIVFCAAGQATDRSFSKQEILSKRPAEFFTLKMEDKEVLATVNHKGNKRTPQDTMTLWIQNPHGFKLAHSLVSGIGESFEKPTTFRVNGLDFVKVPTTPAGSGGFVQENIFLVTPDESLLPVRFQQASETYEGLAARDAIVLTGGEKEFYIQDNEMRFEFWVAREGDPHCCPSAGQVTGTYKIVGTPQYDFFHRKYTGTVEIQVDQMQHVSQVEAHLTK